MDYKTYFPGYHMNKKYWVTILLDGTVNEAKVLDFLDMSYNLIDKKGKRLEGWSKKADIESIKGV